jgi:hypothetical protein
MPSTPNPLQQPRWTQPSQEPQTPPQSFTPARQEPGDFVASIQAAITRQVALRRGGAQKVAKPEPEEEPKTFAERLARAVRRRRPAWQKPSN